MLTTPPAFAAVAFAPFQNIEVGSWPSSVVIADFDGDRRNDVALSTSYYVDDANDFKVFLFRQQPDGQLGAPTRLSTDGQYGDQMGLAAGDVSGDGRADLVVATTRGLDVFVQGRGGQGLGAPTLVPTSSQAFHPVIADVDRDGRADLVTNTRDGVLLLRNTGSVTFTTTTITPEPQWEVEVADLTGDGRPDVAGCSGLNRCSGAVNVFAQVLANGSTSWTQATYPAPAGSSGGCGLGIGDLTGDRRADVALAICGNSPGSLVNVFAQTRAGTLAAPVAYSSYDVPEPIVVADVNGDRRADLVTLHGGWSEAGVYEQQPNGTLGTEQLFPITYASHYEPKGVAVGDVNSDGKPDIVHADYNFGLVILRQQ